MATMTSTSSDDIFILDSIGVNTDYRGSQGADTYILTNQIPASAIITITDKEGLNKIQLGDGLVIASSKFLPNAAELTLSNGAIVRILGASSFTFDIGANAKTGDIATNPNSTYADFAKALGAQVGSTTGTPNYLVPVTTPTFSIVAGDVNVVSEGSNATFTVKLSVAQTTPTTVNYSLSGKGTTTIGSDTGTVAVQGTGITATGVTATGGTLTFAADITTATISVPVTFDISDIESGEGIDLTLTSPSSGVDLGTYSNASKTFLNSTAPRFLMKSSVISGSTLEGSAITFTITPDPLDPVLTRDITLSLDLVGDVKNGRVPADSADFYIAAPEVIFNAGNSLPKTITVNVANDITMEGVQYYTAVLVDTKTGIQKAIPIDGTINDSANVTGPVFIGAEMDTAGTSIDLIYNQALGKAATETTSPFAFVIKVGTNIVTPSSVTVVGSRVKLNLADAITKGINDVTIDYLSPTASALTSNPAIQDILGNDAFSIVKFPVKNNSTVNSLASKLTLAMDSNFNGSSTASTVSLKANSPISTIFDATRAPDIKQIIIDGTKAEVAVNNLATLATVVELYNQPFGNLSVAYAAASPVVTNASDLQRLTVSNVGSTDSVAVVIDKVESLVLVSTNYPNKVGLSGVTAATTIAVEGDKALTITTVPLLLNNFNATSATASINANLSAATKLLSVQGGAGADTITVDATKLDPNALISGNGSADTLFINSGATATLQPRMSTVETLKIGAITGELVFKGDKTTDLTNLSLASTLGANVTLENPTTSNFTVDTNGVTAAKTVTVTNIGTETLNYIAESTSFDNNDAIFKFSNASALTVNVGKNVAQKGAITADKAVSITLNVTSSITLENPTELTSFKGSLNSPTASSLNVNATGTLVPGSETLDLTTSALPKLKTLTITGGGSVSMTAAQYNGLGTITAAGTDTIILSGADNVTAKAGIEKYDLGSAGRTITVPSEVVAVTIKGGASADTIALSASGATITVDDSTVAVTGGAGADNVTFLNTLALADTLSFDGGIGTDSVVLPAFANTITLTNVETITATAGLTAQTITVAGASAVALAAGAGVQNILNATTGSAGLVTINDSATTTSIVTGIATGGTGGYFINTGVLNAAINFSAMTAIAPMTINLNAAGPTAVTITEATATNTGTTTLTGGATTQTVTVTGGATAHTFTSSTALSKINYTAVTAVTAQTITTGAGDDTVAGGGGADSIIVGNGANGVTVLGHTELAALATLVGGSGIDTLTITTPSTTVVDADFSKTTAFDTLVLGAATTATLDRLFTTAGFTSITGSGGIDALTFAGVAPLVSINGGLGADTLAFATGYAVTATIADTDGITVTGATTAANALTFSSAVAATTITGGSAADTFTLSGGMTTATVTGGSGSDTYVLGNYANALTIIDDTATVTGGSAVDAITVANTASFTFGTFTTGAGADILTFADFAITASIYDTDGITVTGATTAINTLTFTSAVAATSITGSTLADVFTLASGAVTTTTITGGTGADVITLGAYANTFTIADATVSVTGSTGVDTLTFNTALTAATVTGGTGGDVIILTSGSTNALTYIDLTGSITGGAGIDTITVANTAAFTSGTFTMGSGADTLAFATGYAVTATIADTDGITVTGATTAVNALTFSSAVAATTITGGSGADIFTLTGGITTATVTGGTGSDTYVLGNYANALTIIDTTATVTGGTGIDAITVANTAAFTAGSITGGTGADTLAFATGYAVTASIYDIDGITVTGATTAINTLTFTSAVAATTVTGGTLADVFTLASGAVTTTTITGGLSTDTITLGAYANTFTIADATVSVTGSTGVDTLTFNTALTAATVTGGTGGDVIILTSGSANTLTYNDVTGSITGGAGIDAITVTNAAAFTSGTFTMGSGADTLAFATAYAVTATIADTDGITVTGATTAVNTLTFTSAVAATSITGGTGIDTFTLASGAVTSATITGGTGADIVTLGNYANTLTIADPTLGAVTGGTLVDTITFSTALTSLTLANSTGTDIIALADGGNILSVADLTVSITGGTGSDAITFTNAAAMTAVTVDGGTATGDSIAAVGAYANTATFKDMDAVTATAGATGSVYTITGTIATAVTAGIGVQTITSTSSATTTVTPIATTTSLVLGSATGDYATAGTAGVLLATISAGSSTGDLNFAALGNVTANAIALTAGTGNVTVVGGAAGDTYTVTGLATDAQTFTGSVSIFNVTAGAGAQTITTGAVTSTVTGGAGSDAITFGTAGAADIAILTGNVPGTDIDSIATFTAAEDVVHIDVSDLNDVIGTLRLSGNGATAITTVAAAAVTVTSIPITGAADLGATATTTIANLTGATLFTTSTLATAIQTNALSGGAYTSGDAFMVTYDNGTDSYLAYVTVGGTYADGAALASVTVTNIVTFTGVTDSSTLTTADFAFIA